METENQILENRENDETRRVEPYPEKPQVRTELTTKTYEYIMPFNYENITVDRRYRGGEFHGVEMFPLAEVAPPAPSSGKPAEGIVVTEDSPIVRVVVIGSACTPPGYVTLEADTVPEFRRTQETAERLAEVEGIMPIRFRINDLWGMHLRFDQWAEPEGGRPFPDDIPDKYKGRFTGYRCTDREFPLTGMSCAIFEIPASTKVRISGGSQIPGWTTDNYPDDNHYSFRIIRTTVLIASQ